MRNLSTNEFCRNFHAFADGTRFARKFATMRECYAALLAGEAGEYSTSWAIWAATQEGVMSDQNLRLFAVRCARRVQHLMEDRRSTDALDVAERYANGEATDDELSAACDAAWYACVTACDAGDAARVAARVAARGATWDAARVAAVDSVRAAALAARDIACDAYDAYDDAWDAERREQLKILAGFGNPVEEEEEAAAE